MKKYIKNYGIRIILLLWFLLFGFIVYMLLVDKFIGNPVENYLSKDNNPNNSVAPTRCTNLPQGYSESDCILDNTATPGQYDDLPDW